ncbi:MAG: ASKHA domain-containing protein, partial [Firmicutes bacterium]|nr:ASKHA domain-containing protein [Bacillota bacterium]
MVFPGGREVRAHVGLTVAEAVSGAAWMDLPCGGRGTCGRCLVRVEGNVSPPGADETRLLSTAALAAGFRLACRAVVLGDARVTLQYRDEMTGGGPPGAGPYRGGKGGLDDISVLALLDGPGMRAVKRHRRAARGHAVGRYMYDPPCRAVAGGAIRGPSIRFGVALDVGTTTIAGYLVNLGGRDGGVAGGGLRAPSVAAAGCATNPQVSRGAEVISRIAYASISEDGVREMSRLVLDGLNALVSRLCTNAGVEPEAVTCATVVGNTCMTCLLLGIDPSPLGAAPYVSPFRGPAGIPAGDIGLGLDGDAEVWVAPAIGGYVGGDAVAVGVVADALSPGRNWLAVDMGTNGEVLLRTGDRLQACSTAAGPAFEGGQVACGMRAGPGAIADVRIARDEGFRAE